MERTAGQIDVASGGASELVGERALAAAYNVLRIVQGANVAEYQYAVENGLMERISQGMNPHLEEGDVMVDLTKRALDEYYQNPTDTAWNNIIQNRLFVVESVGRSMVTGGRIEITDYSRLTVEMIHTARMIGGGRKPGAAMERSLRNRYLAVGRDAKDYGFDAALERAGHAYRLVGGRPETFRRLGAVLLLDESKSTDSHN